MKVSVLMPTYNGGRYLRLAVQSLRAQTATPGADFELIVADDGSTDPLTRRILEDLKLLPWCTVVSTSRRRGVAYARNLAASSAQGEWLAFLDSDDLFTEDALSVRLSLAERYPEAECIATEYMEFDVAPNCQLDSAAGALRNDSKKKAVLATAFASNRPVTFHKPFEIFLGAMPLWTGATMVRRELFQRLGGFPEALPVAEDLFLWLRISAIATVAFAPRITALYRNTAGSLTADKLRLSSATANCYRTLLQAPEFIAAKKDLRRHIASAHRDESYAARSAGKYYRSIHAALAAVRTDPQTISNWSTLMKAPLPTRHYGSF